MSDENIEQLMEEIAGGWSGDSCSTLRKSSWSAGRPSPGNERWTAFHLYYHEDRSRLLVGWLRPLWARLWRDRLISRFFYIRYDLGGPHIRMRALLTDGASASDVTAMIDSSANAFFQRQPSTLSVPKEEIRQRSQQLAARDPWEGMIEPIADNRCVETPFLPEVERYGGQGLVPASYDAFTTASVLALDYVEATREMGWRQRLPICFRILTHLALGLATSQDQWLVIHGYIERWWAGSPLAKLFRTADAVFDREQTTLIQLMHCEIVRTVATLEDTGRTLHGELDAFVIGRRLALDIVEASAGQWRTIVEEHMHTMANRLGLTNRNELYVGRLLLRSARHIADSGALTSTIWSWSEAPTGPETIGWFAETRLCRPEGEQ